jgi:uncharacterized protein
MRYWSNENVLKQPQGQLLLACREAVQQLHPTAEIVLYGSYARNEAHAESDLDLLILLGHKPSPLEIRTLHDRLYEIGLTHDMVVSLLVRDCQDWNTPRSQAMPLYQRIQQEGIRVA